MKDFAYEEIEAATGGFALQNLIGKGSHGCVYKGRLKGGKVVAVKKPSHAQGNSKLRNEIAILASTRSTGIVNLVGVAHSPANCKMLVMEFMSNGSLHHILHSSPKPPSWPQRLALSLDIARAVAGLHDGEPCIIHRDIKSANILLDRDGHARLADFGLAVRNDGSQAVTPMPPPAGTLGYLDPSYVQSDQLGPKSDVFSFGVVLLELISGRKAMDLDCNPSSIVAWAGPLTRAGRVKQLCDRRVPVPPEMEHRIGRILSVAARCVSEEVECRPAMGEVVAELHGIVDGVCWCSARNRAADRVRRFVWAWRLHVKRTIRTRKIECTEHLDGSEFHNCGDR